jgi:uncharacterized secreted protein with C-terminal beta-propeller domain
MSDFDERARKAKENLQQALDDVGLAHDNGEKTVKRRLVKRTAAAGSIAAVALVAGIVGFLPNNSSDSVRLSGNDGAFQLAGALQPFGACDDALDYFKEHAVDFYLKRSGGVGIAEDASGAAEFDSPTSGEKATAAPATTVQPPTSNQRTTDLESAQTPDSATSPAHSTTNVAEKQVDEPDIVKTDGTRIVTVTRGTARLLLANGGNPSVRATLPDNGVQSVFLVGDRLVVLRNDGSDVRTMQYPELSSAGGRTSAVIYDIADLSKPALVGTLEITGAVVDARMVGTQVRLVTTYTPDVNITPQYNQNGTVTDDTKRKLTDLVATSKLETWTPTFTTRNESGSQTSDGQLVECDNLGHPAKFAGISTTSLVTFDAKGTFENRHSAGVVANGNQIYGTAGSLYVTSNEWNDGTRAQSTDIHVFAAAADGVVTYQGSGVVPGSLLNQYSMSEHDGALRVATTTSDQRGWLNRTSVTQGQVAVLKLQDGKLDQVGLVTGLGAKDNESIQSVRFIGARGYVTTFRQTDPFYVLDLSDATSPKVTGELKIPGFSSYLHPINENLILGVGQSGTEISSPESSIAPSTVAPAPSGKGEGSSGVSSDSDMPDRASAPIRGGSSGGVEFSLFDVSNPAEPKKVSSKQYGMGNAGAQSDTKAFLYYEPMNLIVSPLTEWNSSAASTKGTSGMWSGLVLLRPTDSGLVEVGRLQNADARGFNVDRTFIIENNVYQLSQGALQVNSLDTHKQIARLPL